MNSPTLHGGRCRRRDGALLFFMLLAYLQPTPYSQCIAADAQDVLLALRAAIDSISTVEAHYSEYFSGLRGPGIVLGPNGFGKWSEFSWGWEKRSQREYMDGKYAFQNQGQVSYIDTQFAYDGQRLRALTKTYLSGRIAERGDMFAVWDSPLFLLGRNLADDPSRDLVELLANAKLLTVPDTAANLYVLESEFQQGELAYILRVWVDKSVGYLPRRIEVSRKLMKTIMTLIETEDIKKLDQQVWFPLRGRLTRYYVVTPKEYPGKITKAQLDKLPSDKQREILSQVHWETRPLGLGTKLFVTDQSSVHLNQPIDSKRFTVEMPVGTTIFDELENRGYTVGQPDEHSPKSDETSHGVRNVLILIVNAVVIGFVVALLVARRIRSKRRVRL